MAHYTIQVSDHAGAGARIPTKAASESWYTVWDGNIAIKAHAMDAVDKLATEHPHARAFCGKEMGKLWYAVLRTGGVLEKRALQQEWAARSRKELKELKR
jgi:hypothetical protein